MFQRKVKQIEINCMPANSQLTHKAEHKFEKRSAENNDWMFY